MKYKFSKYNLLLKEDKVLFNTRTLALGEIEDEMISIFMSENLERLNGLEEEKLKPFIENGFILAKEISEMDILKQEYWDCKVNNDTLYLTILTTLNCNLKCIYCFEERKNIILNNKVEDKIFKFVEQNISKYKRLNVDWYGGEPLLNIESIESLANKFIDLCRKKNVQYRSSITTNGYELNEDVLKRLVDYKITSAQITLDGPKEIHDIRRFKHNGQGSFDSIIANIKNSKDILDINLRINVDKSNMDFTKELLSYLVDNGLKDLIISIKGVVSSEANPCEESEIDEIEFSRKVIELYKFALQSGFRTTVFDTICNLVRKFCIVDLDSQFIISPDGDVYKCGEAYNKHDPGRIGTLDIDGTFLCDDNRSSFWDKDPFVYLECAECKILPYCMGGCSLKRMVKNRKPCLPEHKNNLTEIVRIYYQSLIQ